jgi:hypothetical protein
MKTKAVIPPRSADALALCARSGWYIRQGLATRQPVGSGCNRVQSTRCSIILPFDSRDQKDYARPDGRLVGVQTAT